MKKSTTTRGTFGPDVLRDPVASAAHEWLETDGLGGFASGTIGGIRTRRYHGLLLAAMKPPTERRVFVQDIEEDFIAGASRFSLSAHRYAPDAVYPRGLDHLTRFHLYPWPTWTYEFEGDDGARIMVDKEIFVPRDEPTVVITWTLRGSSPARFFVRPLLSCRDHHTIARRNNLIDPRFESSAGRVAWHPYPGVPTIHARHTGTYQHSPDWYMQFAYDAERERGLDWLEDLWTPGAICFDLAPGETAAVLFSLTASDEPVTNKKIAAMKKSERNRRARIGSEPADLVQVLDRAAEDYLVRRNKGLTIVAGYPWFTDWGRDTFISMRGICLARGRMDIARKILTEWSSVVSEGMLPNHFPDEGETPHYNSVDASLWYVVVVKEYIDRGGKGGAALLTAAEAIMRGYRDGTRFGIRLDEDGLIHAGEPGSQLTWMDAKYEEETYTPRIGKPVEIQALWINALAAMKNLTRGKSVAEWSVLHKRALVSFRKKFWNADRKCLLDVVGGPEGDDDRMRPNQIFAVSLPEPILGKAQARAVVDAVEKHLLTPLGLRTLAAWEPGYIGIYTGSRRDRDASYHNGTVWPWLLGPFIEAWVRVRGSSASAKKQARKFLGALEAHVMTAGLGHISEIADGDAPHHPKGCPAQAWSVAEALRVLTDVLGEGGNKAKRKKK